MAKSLKKNENVRLHAYMDRGNVGITKLADRIELGDLEDPRPIVDCACSNGVGDGRYVPSPRAFGITGVGKTVARANKICEDSIGKIKGEGLFHRRDIGTPDMMERYDCT